VVVVVVVVVTHPGPASMASFTSAAHRLNDGSRPGLVSILTRSRTPMSIPPLRVLYISCDYQSKAITPDLCGRQIGDGAVIFFGTVVETDLTIDLTLFSRTCFAQLLVEQHSLPGNRKENGGAVRQIANEQGSGGNVGSPDDTENCEVGLDLVNVVSTHITGLGSIPVNLAQPLFVQGVYEKNRIGELGSISGHRPQKLIQKSFAQSGGRCIHGIGGTGGNDSSGLRRYGCRGCLLIGPVEKSVLGVDRNLTHVGRDLEIQLGLDRLRIGAIHETGGAIGSNLADNGLLRVGHGDRPVEDLAGIDVLVPDIGPGSGSSHGCRFSHFGLFGRLQCPRLSQRKLEVSGDANSATLKAADHVEKRGLVGTDQVEFTGIIGTVPRGCRSFCVCHFKFSPCYFLI
jgi:hypothetical protein